MFQPQPTPYAANFSSYGPAHNQDPEQHAFNFQSAALALRSGGPIVFDSPIFSPVTEFRSAALPVAQHRYGTMNTPPTDDMAAQEALARAYQPDVKGPLVGEKKSSMAITEEYAKADPIYVAKTSTLPNTYSHYRPVKGDGNCGWRAIGLSYFEILVKLGDKKLVRSESVRMMSLSDSVVTMCGYEPWIFEDMRDACLNLLGDIMGLVPGPHLEAQNVILDRFNDPEISNGIVYWLRLLASAYLRTHANTFQDFIPELMGVENFCKDVLEPTNTEIEHLGMTLLVDVLLGPIGIAVDIVYLDRSEGTHVNLHHFGRGSGERPQAIIHLLYRPGHYDILYKDLPAPPRALSMSHQQILEHASAASDVQVNRATSFTQRHSIQGTPAGYQGMDMGLIASLPTLFGSLPPSHGYPEPCTTSADFSQEAAYAPSYTDSSARTTSSISPSSSVSPTPHEVYTPTTTIPIHSAHSLALSPEPLSPGPLTPSRSMSHPFSPTPLLSPSASAGQFRPSMYQYKEDWGDGPAQGFQTSTFKNSHYNVSHYNNPNFQPEQWTPDCDEAVGRITRRGTS